MTNCATKKNFSHVKCVDTSDLAAKIRFCCFESWNWWTSHLVNVPTSLNNLKTKVDDLDTGKLITLVDLKEDYYLKFALLFHAQVSW